MRDYVLSWYQTISDEEEFPFEARKCLQITMSNFSARVKEVDWIPFFTEKIPFDFRSHIRLYHRTLLHMKEMNVDGNILHK